MRLDAQLVRRLGHCPARARKHWSSRLQRTGYGVPGALCRPLMRALFTTRKPLGCPRRETCLARTLTEAFRARYIDFQVPNIRLNLVGKSSSGRNAAHLFPRQSYKTG